MSMSDPIADMLTRIRNAGKAKKIKVDIPGSKLKLSIAEILRKKGYIRNYEFINDNKQGILRIFFKDEVLGKKGIVSIVRVSKPSRRVYVKARNIKSVYNGLGIAILSTSKGLMSDIDAKKNKIGGEIICTVW